MNNYEKAKRTIKNYCPSHNYCYYPITGPTGPQGPVSIKIGNTKTLNPGVNAKVLNSGTKENVILDFEIPSGSPGIAEKIIINSTTTGNAGTNALIKDNYIDNTHYLDFIIPKGFDGASGDIGPTGPEGPQIIKASYVVSFEDNYPSEGLEIKENALLPLARIEINQGNIINIQDNILKFLIPGHYKINFIVNAAIKKDNTVFDEKKDLLSIGFRKKNSDDIYIGNSLWSNDSISKSIIAQGILAVTNINDEYELVNLTKRPIYLKVPKIENINTRSFFVTLPVNLVIEYLGY